MNELATFDNLYFMVVLTINIICAIHIIMHKHEQPVSAVLWLAFIVIFPRAFGVILYLFFGINRITRRLPKAKLTNSKIQKLHKTSKGSFFSYLKLSTKFQISPSNKEQYSLILNKIVPESPLMLGNSIQLLRDGSEVYPAMLEAIKSAKHHIHLCSYIFLCDKEGKLIMDALKDKAEEGVQVKVIFDNIGSEPFSNAKQMRKWDKKVSNLQVKPFAVLDLLAPYRVQLRNHRKLLLVDGKTAFIGGINITEENTIEKGPSAIHDLHCCVMGPIVGQLQFVFLRDWCDVAKVSPLTLFNEKGYFPPSEIKGTNMLRICASGPGQSHEATHKVFLTAANTAQKSLWIMTPYFVPDPALIAALKMAAARNVEIRIIVPCKSDHWLVQSASRSFYDTLLEAGVRIFERDGCFNHSKAMLVDNKWSFMGSSNCDSRSFRLNYELDFICEQGPFNYTIHRQLTREVEKSTEIVLSQHVRRNKITKFKENLSSLFTPIL